MLEHESLPEMSIKNGTLKSGSNTETNQERITIHTLIKKVI
jgi:hypothetical protein